MEKKKLKLSISGSSKKTFNSIEQAKNQSKNSVVIGRKTGKGPRKHSNFKQNKTQINFKQEIKVNTKPFITNNQQPKSDFEKRRLAEQRATKRLKVDTEGKEKKSKLGTKKRELKLTVSRALSDEIETRERSLASVKRARLKEKKSKPDGDEKKEFKKVIRDVKIPLE